VNTLSVGPSRYDSSPGTQLMFKCPPGTFTFTLLFNNFFLIPIIAHADVPVPEDKVSPAPLSNILALISFFEMIFTISKFILLGKAGLFSTKGPIFFSSKLSTSLSVINTA
tara:strand:+ start:354 stop:686 length:333 start_codon:yes stop_codon:yes gene_type:complete